MNNIKKENVLKTINEKNVKYIKLQFTDLLGNFKSKEIPATEMQLDKIFNNEIAFDGSSVKGLSSINNADLYLSPDWTTFQILPFIPAEQGVVARVICFIMDQSKNYYDACPRYMLYNNTKKLVDKNITQFNVGFEPEFFLLKKIGNDYNLTDNAGYFDQAPSDTSELCRREITNVMTEMGYVIEASHHEVAYSQHEINFMYDEAIYSADKVQTFKYIVKYIANKYDLVATFMPKPFNGINGSGMHTNISLADGEGNNIFYDDKRPELISNIAEKFVAGILKNAPALSLVTNPTINSYKRLVKGYEAPVYISWSYNNRSAMIRIPAANKHAKRIEVRNVDCTANPYLALACILEAGMMGIVEDYPTVKPVVRDVFKTAYKTQKTLPQSLEEGLQIFKKSKSLRKILGDKMFFDLIRIKEQEVEEYNLVVHQFEIDKYI